MGWVPEMDCSFFFFPDLILILDCEHKTSHGKNVFPLDSGAASGCVCVCVCVSVLIFVLPEAIQSHPKQLFSTAQPPAGSS